MRPANIIINEDGQIKVISNRTCPGQLSNFEKAIESKAEHVYLGIFIYIQHRKNVEKNI